MSIIVVKIMIFKNNLDTNSQNLEETFRTFVSLKMVNLVKTKVFNFDEISKERKGEIMKLNKESWIGTFLKLKK